MSDPGARVVGAFMPWARVEAAVSLLAVDPQGLRGLWLRGRAGPVRDRVLAALEALPMPVRRVHPSVSDEVLLGGIDLTASLAAGRGVATAGLPGGGGTPLAAGLHLAGEVARLTRSRGMTPTIALLTDGRGNVALDGRGDRATAMAEAQVAARRLCAGGTPALVIDTATRPQAELRPLAAMMGATYLPLPRADARRMADALSGALG